MSIQHENTNNVNAEGLTLALGGQWRGGRGEARCPAHDDKNPSLTVSPGRSVPVVVRCHAGCTQSEVIAALTDRGLWSQGGGHRPPTKVRRYSPRHHDHTKLARKIWKAASPASGTIVEKYLQRRGITVPVPPTLRYHRDLIHGPTGLYFPAMVAAVQNGDGAITGIHRTYLADNAHKAAVRTPKLALAPIGTGAVRLGAAGPVLGLAEGVETALSAMQLHQVPVWAALGSRLDRIALPETTQHIIIFGDNGATGHAVARKAAAAIRRSGRTAEIRFPPSDYGDWNNFLAGRGVCS